MEDVENKMVTRVRTARSYDQYGCRHNEAYLTIKQGGRRAISRTEFEYEIPYEDGEYMLGRLCDTVLSKKRTIIPYTGDPCNMTIVEWQDLKWEVDVFTADTLNGLMVAEIELPRPDAVITLPNWITDEVTEDPYYINSNLIKLINT